MRVKTFYRTLRFISAIVLFFFVWTFGPIWQAVAFAAESRKASGARREGTTRAADTRLMTSGEKFEKNLESIRELVNAAEEKSNKGQEPAAELDAIKAKKAQIETIDAELKSEFAATEKRLKDAKLPQVILDRHAAFVKNYEKSLAQLKSEIDDIDKAKTTSDRKAKLEKTRIHLEKVKLPKKHVPLDPNNLPNRMVKAKARMPRTTPEEFQRDYRKQKAQSKQKIADSRFMPDLLAAQISGLVDSAFRNPKSAIEHRPILIAANGPLTGLLPSSPQPETHAWPSSVPSAVNDLTRNSELSTLNLALASQSDAPSADDLAETLEVQFTQDIKDLAAQLGNNSLRIFEAVRNNFRYEPYYGSLKGAQQTLREKAGNDCDLASLLISTYRAAGIPARYVMATISMPLSQAQSWLGIDDPKMVGRLLASAGIPVAVDYLSGNVRIEHVLVQAWVPYQNGRGALNGPGDTWVYVDPSFKETKVTQILNQTIPAFDQTQYLNQLRPEDPSEYYSGLLQENLNITAPGRTVYAIARHREIVPLNFGMLLGMPQYDIITAGGHFQEIPDQFRYKVVFELTDSETLENSITYQAATVELAGKRVTLSYSPATSADQTIINNYGDIYNTPAYLVKLKPELKLEGTSIAQGMPIGSGSIQPFTMRFISPAGDLDQVVNNAVSGAYYAVAFDLQTVTQGMVFERTQKLQAMNDFIAAGGTATLDDHAGELLYATALTYFQKLDAANRTAQELLKFVDLRGVSEAIFSIDVNITYFFGVPASIDVSGVHIDVDRDMHLPIPVDGNTSKIKEFNLLIGSNSSYFEHKIVEDVYPTEAISAVKGLQLANAQGIPIQTINRDNMNAVLPTLQVRSEIKADIENAVNAGKEVTIPQNEITLGDWHGLGYIVMNPQTGEAGYIISGGYAGGSSTSMSFATWIKSQALSLNTAQYVLVGLIEAALYNDYVYFSGKDNQLGTIDDVRFKIVEGKNAQELTPGPVGTFCAGTWGDNYYAPHGEELWGGAGSSLIDISHSDTSIYLSKRIQLSEMMGHDAPNFYTRIAPALVQVLEMYFDLLAGEGIEIGTPKITSGYRSRIENCRVYGNSSHPVDNSTHRDGIAADVSIADPADKDNAGEIGSSLIGAKGGVGWKKYDESIVHIDLDSFGGARRW